MNIKRLFLRSCAAMLAASGLALTSCQSDAYYQEQAVNRAREYLLDKTRDLPQLKREYVKFNKPVIMAANILGESISPTNTHIRTELAQVCIAWIVPGEDNAFVVFGVSENNLSGWEPYRVIRKRYAKPDFNRIAAVNAASQYVVNNMLFLPDDATNRVRFSTPKIVCTDFEVDLNKLGKLSDSELAAERKKEQVSIVWNSAAPNTMVVVTGVCGRELAGWHPVGGLERDADDLKKHTRPGNPAAVK